MADIASIIRTINAALMDDQFDQADTALAELKAYVGASSEAADMYIHGLVSTTNILIENLRRLSEDNSLPKTIKAQLIAAVFANQNRTHDNLEKVLDHSLAVNDKIASRVTYQRRSRYLL